MSNLELPSTKFFIKDLKNAVNISKIANNDSIIWQASDESRTQFSNVWIQGDLKKISTDSLYLSDETGECRVIISKLQECKFILPQKIGIYVMAIGLLVMAGSEPIIRATKIQDLSSIKYANELWKYEIEDLRLHTSALKDNLF